MTVYREVGLFFYIIGNQYIRIAIDLQFKMVIYTAGISYWKIQFSWHLLSCKAAYMYIIFFSRKICALRMWHFSSRLFAGHLTQFILKEFVYQCRYVIWIPMREDIFCTLVLYGTPFPLLVIILSFKSRGCIVNANEHLSTSNRMMNA